MPAWLTAVGRQNSLVLAAGAWGVMGPGWPPLQWGLPGGWPGGHSEGHPTRGHGALPTELPSHRNSELGARALCPCVPHVVVGWWNVCGRCSWVGTCAADPFIPFIQCIPSPQKEILPPFPSNPKPQTATALPSVCLSLWVGLLWIFHLNGIVRHAVFYHGLLLHAYCFAPLF